MSDGALSATNSKRSSVLSSKRVTLAPIRSNVGANDGKSRTIVKPGFAFLPDLNMSRQSFSEQASMVSDQDPDLDSANLDDGDLDEMNLKVADLLQSIVSKAGELMQDWSEVREATDVIKLGKTGESFKSQTKPTAAESQGPSRGDRVKVGGVSSRPGLPLKVQQPIRGLESLQKKLKDDQGAAKASKDEGLGIAGQSIGAGSLNDNTSMASKSSSKNSFQIRGSSLAGNTQKGGSKQRALSRPLK